MAESEGIQEVINQGAIQEATVVMMVLIGMNVGPHPAPTASLREPQWQRHSGLALEKPLFNWNVQERCVELLNFEKEVMNILETKAYELTDDGNVPVIQNWLGQECFQLIKMFMNEEKEKCKMVKGLFFGP